MKKSFLVFGMSIIFLALLVAIAFSEKPEATQQTLDEGKRIYNQVCYVCHGTAGKGDGSAAFFLAPYRAPRPRNFTDGVYKFRTTPSGTLPTDEDLFRTVTNGIPGFMPSFMGLSESERWSVIFYIKKFSERFEEEEVEQPISIGERPYPTSSSIRKGREVYVELKCWQCHGKDAQGNGPSANELTDDWGMKITPQDLTKPFTFRGGDTPEDIFRTFMTGLDGTPMPSYADILEGREEDAWHLVNYILSLSRPQRATP